MILILCSKLKWSSGANNEATRRPYLAPEVVCQTEWRENKITRARCKNSGNMSIFNHIMFRFCFIYLFTSATEANQEFSLSAIFPTKFEFPGVFHKESITRIWADNRWPPNQSNCLKSNNHWTVFNSRSYPHGNLQTFNIKLVEANIVKTNL